MIRASLEGYNRAYPMIVRLHLVSDVEDCMERLLVNGLESLESGFSSASAQKTGNKSKMECHSEQLPSLVSMKGRRMMTCSSLKVREAILSSKRVCFEELRLVN